MIVCGLAEAAVTETEHDAVAAPEAASAQLAAGLNESVPLDDEKVTFPVGDVATPAVVLTTVAVTVTGTPTGAAPLEKETAVEVVRLLTVSAAPAADPW